MAGACENHVEGLLLNIFHALEFILCSPDLEAGRRPGLVPGWWPCIYQVCGFVGGSTLAWAITGSKARLRPVLLVTLGREDTGLPGSPWLGEQRVCCGCGVGWSLGMLCGYVIRRVVTGKNLRCLPDCSCVYLCMKMCVYY